MGERGHAIQRKYSLSEVIRGIWTRHTLLCFPGDVQAWSRRHSEGEQEGSTPVMWTTSGRVGRRNGLVGWGVVSESCLHPQAWRTLHTGHFHSSGWRMRWYVSLAALCRADLWGARGLQTGQLVSPPRSGAWGVSLWGRHTCCRKCGNSRMTVRESSPQRASVLEHRQSLIFGNDALTLGSVSTLLCVPWLDFIRWLFLCHETFAQIIILDALWPHCNLCNRFPLGCFYVTPFKCCMKSITNNFWRKQYDHCGPRYKYFHGS